MSVRSILAGALLGLLAPCAALAGPAQFDLAGPTLQVQVTRGGVTLPISETPNLEPGEKLWIKPDLPGSETVHYLLVAAFLRGATNPPPDNWFFHAETWTRGGRNGLKMTVPKGAQEVIVFLAPQAGGDFRTIVNAVRGRPGSFVRAVQDLDQAALDRSRLDTFLTAVRKPGQNDPDHLKTVSALLARSLAIKLNTECFQKMPELQAPCLMAGRDELVLDEGHGASMVAQLTSGDSADLARQLSYAPQAGMGYYSPYVAAVIDMARIMDSFHTAAYQYIPALTTEQDDRLKLLLNTPPSFHNPMSVLVTALPPVEPARTPPLEPVAPNDAYCATRAHLVLPVEGAPLVYSTGYAHDMALRITDKNGKPVDVPVRADAEKGGFVVDTTTFSPDRFGDSVDAVLHGLWGFEPFEGPSFRLQNARAQAWKLSADEQQALVIGRKDTITLAADASACVDSVKLEKPSGEVADVVWKAAGPDKLAVSLPLQDADAGAVTVLIHQAGLAQPDAVQLDALAKASRIDEFTFHAGDASGLLEGLRLDEVAGVSFEGVEFAPGILTTNNGSDTLPLIAADEAHKLAKLRPGQSAVAKVALKDGRKVRLKVVVGQPRPKVTLIAKSIQVPPADAPVAVQLTDPEELPQNGQLTFSIRADDSKPFSHKLAIQVATLDGSASTTLTPANGLILEDPKVAVATLDTAKAFDASAFGPLQFRVVQDGTPGDWQPLAVLVRLPSLQALDCAHGASKPCQLVGANLFLIHSVARDRGFDHAVEVAEGFPSRTLLVPHPRSGRLYLRLHDAPDVVNYAGFQVTRAKAATETRTAQAKAAEPRTGAETKAAAQAKTAAQTETADAKVATVR